MIKHVPGAFEYITDEGKKLGELTYSQSNGVIDGNHTFVDPSLRGQGIAGKLFDAFIAYARKNDLKVVGSCSYVENKLRSASDLDDVKA